MDELEHESEQNRGPVNPYATAFFWIWGLTCLALAGIRTDSPTYREQLDGWHRQHVDALRDESDWLNLAGLFWLREGHKETGTDTGYDLTTLNFNQAINPPGAFTPFATYPLPPRQNRLAVVGIPVAIRVGKNATATSKRHDNAV